MVLMAAALVVDTTATTGHSLDLPGSAQVVLGLVAGFAIGVVAAVMGVAGGELLIPTIVLLYGVDIKIAGSLSLLSPCRPCWSRSPATAATQLHRPRRNLRFTIAMAAGSIAGTLLGGLLLGVVPDLVLVPALALLLLLSSVKLWRHARE